MDIQNTFLDGNLILYNIKTKSGTFKIPKFLLSNNFFDKYFEEYDILDLSDYDNDFLNIIFNYIIFDKYNFNSYDLLMNAFLFLDKFEFTDKYINLYSKYHSFFVENKIHYDLIKKLNFNLIKEKLYYVEYDFENISKLINFDIILNDKKLSDYFFNVNFSYILNYCKLINNINHANKFIEYFNNYYDIKYDKSDHDNSSRWCVKINFIELLICLISYCKKNDVNDWIYWLFKENFELFLNQDHLSMFIDKDDTNLYKSDYIKKTFIFEFERIMIHIFKIIDINKINSEKMFNFIFQNNFYLILNYFYKLDSKKDFINLIKKYNKKYTIVYCHLNEDKKLIGKKTTIDINKSNLLKIRKDYIHFCNSKKNHHEIDRCYDKLLINDMNHIKILDKFIECL